LNTIVKGKKVTLALVLYEFEEQRFGLVRNHIDQVKNLEFVKNFLTRGGGVTICCLQRLFPDPRPTEEKFA